MFVTIDFGKLMKNVCGYELMRVQDNDMKIWYGGQSRTHNKKSDIMLQNSISKRRLKLQPTMFEY